MELWWHLRGWTRLRLTSADCPGRLRRISGEMKLENIAFPDELTAEFTVLSGDAGRLTGTFGPELRTVASGGLPGILRGILRWRRLAGLVLLLGALTVWLPGRVWFVRVEGNHGIPQRRILEAAEASGISFGARAGQIRSEAVKNSLLFAIPELRWAGVNTEGCTAVITVAERSAGEPERAWEPGDLIARTDGLVTGILVQRGTALVQPGDAVRAGQLLVSGVTELGNCIHVDRAEGELWGLTRREFQLAVPAQTRIRRETGQVKRRYSLRIGKKSVNFSNDSGILYGTCVRMRTVNYLMLPGGFRLPVALVTDTYTMCEIQETPRRETDWLTEAARRTVRGQLRGGGILREEFTSEGGLLTAVFECREQIGVFRPGNDMERDTFVRENGER